MNYLLVVQVFVRIPVGSKFNRRRHSGSFGCKKRGCPKRQSCYGTLALQRFRAPDDRASSLSTRQEQKSGRMGNKLQNFALGPGAVRFTAVADAFVQLFSSL